MILVGSGTLIKTKARKQLFVIFVEEQEFESSDEENNINVVELRSEDETKADVI